MTQERARGDDPAEDFDAFVRANGARLRAVVGRVARGRGDSDDLLQEALARAYEKRHTFVSGRHAVNWIAHVARCLLVDEQRSWYRRNVVTGAEIAPDTVPVGDDPADLVATADEGRRAVRALAALTAAQRQLLWDHAVGGESYADIARRTGTPLATIRSTAHRARAAARLAFGGAGSVASGVVALRRRLSGWRSRLRLPATAGDAAGAGVVALGLLLGGGAVPAVASPVPPAAARGAGQVAAAKAALPGVLTAARAAPSTTRSDEYAAPPSAPSPPPAAKAAPAVQEVRFSGTYSSRCTLTPTGDTNRLFDRYTYDCTFSARSTTCVSLDEDRSALPCVVRVAGRVVGDVWYYAASLGTGEVQCQPEGGTTDQLAASEGRLRYQDSPTAPLLFPVRNTVSHKVVTLSGITEIDPGKYFGVSATLPFTCADTTDAPGFRGQGSYRSGTLQDDVTGGLPPPGS